jgi:hypothetical protein
MGDLAQLSRGDQFPGGGDGGCIPVVEADRGGHTLRVCGAGDGEGVGNVEPHGFFDPQVLPRVDDRGSDLAVQEVGRGDADCPDVRIFDDRAPVSDRGSCAELARRVGGPPRNVVGDGNQVGEFRGLRIMMAHAQIRLRVHAAHPAEADDCDGHGLLGGSRRRFGGGRCLGGHCDQPPAHERRDIGKW